MPLHHDQIDDFVTLTLAQEMRRSWVDISLTLQHYTFAEYMIRGPGNRIPQYSGGSKPRLNAGVKGPKLKWRVQVSGNSSFRDSELFAKETPGVNDHMTSAEVNWTKQTVNFSYDHDEEEFQGGFEELANLISVRRHAMWNAWYEGMETRMWTAPTSSTQNPRKPFGIPFWLQKATAAAFSFQGGDPSGFSDGAGGIATGTYANWKNGAFQYTSVSENDLWDKLDKATEYCQFYPPDDFAQLDKGFDWAIYTVFSVIQKARKQLKGQNDNIGSDLGKYRNKVLFKGVPLCRVPALDDSNSGAYDSTDPVYGINWNTMSYKYRSDKKPEIKKPLIPQHQPTVRTVYGVSWGQFCCINRRANFVGHVA